MRGPGRFSLRVAASAATIGLVVGLTLDELVVLTGCGPAVLRTVLLEEVRRGRVSCEDGRYCLVAGSLPPRVAEALRQLAAAPDASAVVGRARPRRGDRVHASERANLSWAVY